MTEEWRDVVGWEGVYAVSSLGRFKRLAQTSPAGTRYDELIRTGSVGDNGYTYMSLSMGRPLIFKTVHRMVAEAFLPNPEGFRLVRHLNDVRSDNRLVNLAWGTDSDNRLDAVRNGGDYWTSRTHCNNGHEFTAENTAYRDIPGRICRQCERDRGARYRDKKRLRSIAEVD